MNVETSKSDDQSNYDSKKRRSALRLTLGIGSALAMGIVATNLNAELSLTGRPTIDLLLLAGIANLVVYIFVRTSDSLSAGGQVVFLLSVILLQVVAYFSFKLDGLYGNGYPRIVFSWTPKSSDGVFESMTKPVEVVVSNSKGWNGFRGSNCSGVVEDIEIENWTDAPPKLVWSRSIGGGWSSFAIAGNVCVTHEQRGENEVLACYELATGNPVWEHQDRACFAEISSGEGPRATPTIFEKHVYSFGATGILNCVELDNGECVWRRDVLKERQLDNCIFGMTGSPLVVGEVIVVNPGGKGCSMIAYDRFSGNEIWSAGDEVASYCSPQYAVVCGMPSVLDFNGDGLSCRRLSDGERMFHIPWISNPAEKNNVCQPIICRNSEAAAEIFVSSGYGQGCCVFQILRFENRFKVSKVWANKNLKSKFASAVIDGECVYGLDNGILTCINTQDGERHWKKGRYGHGQLIRIGDSILVQSETGDIVHIRCSQDQLIEECRLEALKSKTWNHPAFSGRYLLLRNDRQAICFDLELRKLSKESIIP